MSDDDLITDPNLIKQFRPGVRAPQPDSIQVPSSGDDTINDPNLIKKYQLNNPQPDTSPALRQVGTGVMKGLVGMPISAGELATDPTGRGFPQTIPNPIQLGWRAARKIPGVRGAVKGAQQWVEGPSTPLQEVGRAIPGLATALFLPEGSASGLAGLAARALTGAAGGALGSPGNQLAGGTAGGILASAAPAAKLAGETPAARKLVGVVRKIPSAVSAGAGASAGLAGAQYAQTHWRHSLPYLAAAALLALSAIGNPLGLGALAGQASRYWPKDNGQSE